MNKSIGLVSLLGAVMGSAALKLVYGINNPYILLCVNLIIFIVSFYMLNKDYKDKNEKKENEKNELEQLIEDNMESINLIKEALNKQIECSSKGFINLQKLLDSKLSSIEVQMAHNNKDLVASINEQIDRINNSLEKIHDENKVNMVKALEMINSLQQSFEAGNKKLEEMAELDKQGSGIQAEILENQKQQVDKLIDLNTVLKNIEGKNEDIAELIDNQGEKLEDIKDELINFKNESNSKIRDCIESNENIVRKYEIIQECFAKELAKLTTKNENITNLIKDSYKVLNEVAASL